MSVRPAIVRSKQRNRINDERLYASFSEGVNDGIIATKMTPRDVYLYRGLDKSLLTEKPRQSRFTNTRSKSNVTSELLQRYKQSMAPSHPAYHSALTMDEALNPPWSLHYNIKRQPATPNFVSNTSNKVPREESARRGQSAPLVRSPTPPDMLTIPEPRFPTVVTTEPLPVKSRSSSAMGCYEASDAMDRKQRRREAQSAHLASLPEDIKLTDETSQQFARQTTDDQIERPVQIIFTKADPSVMPPPPIYVYKKLATWSPEQTFSPPLVTPVEGCVTPVNPHYVHRPAVIAAENTEKKTIEKRGTSSKRTRKDRHAREKRNEPLIATTPMPQTTRLSLETEGVKLVFDPRLTLDDKSPNLHKYFIDGRLYLIKDHRYNVLNNVDPSTIQKLNQSLTLSPRPKYYQTVSIDKYQFPKPPMEIHYNAPETFFYNTIPKRRHRYIINPNFISENLNVNKVALGQRPPTTTIYA